MRLILLPLTRKPASVIASPSRTPEIDTFKLFHFWALRGPITESDTSLVTRAIIKSVSLWDNLGKADKTSWKKKVYDFGQKLLAKIEFEEWSLKSIPSNVTEKSISCIYPPSYTSEEELRRFIQKFTEIRRPYHIRYAVYSSIWLPITAPIALVPLIPNFPMFYALFRLYSHYKAGQAAKVLQNLLRDNRLVFKPCKQIDEIYNQQNEIDQISDEKKRDQEEEINFDKNEDLLLAEREVLISELAVKRIGNVFSSSELNMELHKARLQVIERIRSKNENIKITRDIV